MIPILFGVLLVTFVMTRSMPGNPFLNPDMSRMNEDYIAMLTDRLGLNDPIHIQFFKYFQNFMGPFFAWAIFIYMGAALIFGLYKTIRFGFNRINPKVKIAEVGSH